MALDPNLVGLHGTTEFEWSEDDVMLYAVTLNCGADLLQFVTENSEGVELQALPTFATVLMDVARKRGVHPPQWEWYVDGPFSEFPFGQLLDGGRTLRFFEPVASSGRVTVEASITGIWDKGSGARIDQLERIFDASTKVPLWEIDSWYFIRGAGGWGGPPEPERERHDPPSRPPDGIARYEIGADQAYLYRLNGDHAPVHSDPVYAERFGFSRPLLHGLCTYGFGGLGVLRLLCGDNPSRLASMTGRFSNPVYPGDTLSVKVWNTDGGAVYRTENQDGLAVVDRGFVTLRS